MQLTYTPFIKAHYQKGVKENLDINILFQWLYSSLNSTYEDIEYPWGVFRVRFFLVINYVEYRDALILGVDLCSFEEGTFQDTKVNCHFVLSTDSHLSCFFIFCLFFKIDLGKSFYVLYLNSAVEGIQDRCSYSNDTPSYAWGDWVWELNHLSKL